jgi:hypothetical protein
VMIASAAPIAVAANVARIVLTGVLYEIAGRWPNIIDLETAGETIHAWAGYLMMPIGLLMLLGEMSLLSKLMIDPTTDRLMVSSRTSTGATAPATAPVTEAAQVANPPKATVATTARVLQRRRH